MNRCVLIGRLCKNPETRYSNELAISRFTLAVDRKGDGTDFPNCVAFGKTAEFAEKYLTKGMKIAIEGRIQTGSYEKDGKKVYTTDIVAESLEFVEKKEAPNPSNDDFVSIPDGVQEELPFE